MSRKRKSRSKKLGVLDFETDPFKYGSKIEPFTCGVFTGDDYVNFWGDDCVREVCEYIKDKNLRIYAHNGGRFDFFFMLEYLDKSFFMINNRIAKASLGDTILLDSYLILPLPLSFYKKGEINYDIMAKEVRNEPNNKKEILDYLYKDCIYLYEWVDKFITRFGTKLTVSQAAFSELEKTGYPCKTKSSEHYDTKFRPFYFGGRTQAFVKGFIPGDIKCYDIVSAYPFAMKSNHPFGTAHHVIECPPRLPSCGFYFAEITAVSRGCLPWRYDKGKKVCYPDDGVTRKYTATSWEILAGMETGTLDVISIERVYVWEKTRNFNEYIDKFFDEKAEGKVEGDQDKVTFSKFMLVSAYGKFGADPRKYKKSALCDWDDVPLDEDDYEEMSKLEMEFNEYMEYKEWKVIGDTEFGKTFWSRPDPGDSFYNVATAASITGWVRAYLWHAVCKSDEPFYCDTDSLKCRKFYGKVGNDLGEWEDEGDGVEGIYIGGKKLYTMRKNYCGLEYDKEKKIINDKTIIDNGLIQKAHKGARLTHDEIVDVVINGKTIEWYSEAPSFSLSYGRRYVKRDIKMT